MEVIKGKITGTKINCPHCGNEIIIKNNSGNGNKKKSNPGRKSSELTEKDFINIIVIFLAGLIIYFIFFNCS